MAPTAAILLVGGIYLQREEAKTWPVEQPAPTAQAPQVSPRPQTAAAAYPELADLNAAVQSAIIESATAPVTPVAAPAPAPQADDVTRTATPDLLALAPQPEPVAAPAPPLPEVDAEAAASFFNNAQNRLAAESHCADDLRALAAQTRVYFPSGGLAGEAAGMDAARLVGQVAADCPGYSLRVEGHSDPSGNPLANEKLSLKRAETVVARIAAMGVDTSDFVAVGLGDTQPSAMAGPKPSDYYDRRVEFSVVQTITPVRFSATVPQLQDRLPACAKGLSQQAALLRQFYAPGAITVPGNEIENILAFAGQVARCDGARLRIFGHFTDNPGTRETPSTARLRALVMMGALVNGGVPSDQVLVAAPSASIQVPGQPALPRSRVDFQVVTD